MVSHRTVDVCWECPTQCWTAFNVPFAMSCARVVKYRPMAFQVKPGDTMSSLARKAGVTLESLVASNPHLSSKTADSAAYDSSTGINRAVLPGDASEGAGRESLYWGLVAQMFGLPIVCDRTQGQSFNCTSVHTLLFHP
jgi:hypothetical protein